MVLFVVAKSTISILPTVTLNILILLYYDDFKIIVKGDNTSKHTHVEIIRNERCNNVCVIYHKDTICKTTFTCHNFKLKPT